MEANVTWKGRMSFTGTADSGFTLPLGADPSVGGDDDGFRPMELFATGLAGCTAMDVISILKKKRQDVTAFEVKARVETAQEHPQVFTSGIIEYSVTGHEVDETAVVRAIELSAVRYCPGQAMMGKAMPIRLMYFIYKDLDNGERSLVKSGEYVVTGEKIT